MSHAAVFNPVVDAVTCGASADMDAGWRERWRAAIGGSISDTLASLRRSFGGAIDLHGVPGWLVSSAGVDGLAAAGCVFTALDYFNWPASPGRTSSALRDFVQRRHLDCWHDNAAALLEWQAVQQRVPEEWLPRELVERQLASRLRRHPMVARVEVSAALALDPPGGAKWLRDRSQEQWRAVNERIAAGECCAVATFAPGGPRVLLAFANDGGLRCYDPAESSLVTTISPASVDGLMQLRYAPVAPPLGGAQRLADAVGLRQTIWRLARSWRLVRAAV